MGVGRNLTSSLAANNLSAQVLIRPAQQDDCDNLWHWRNDLVTRTNSLNTEAVPFDQHCKWFEAVLSDPNQFLLLGVLVKPPSPENQAKIGMVRFDVVPVNDFDCAIQKMVVGVSKAIVSINLNPEFRGKGFSVPLLSKAIEFFKQDIGLASSNNKISYIEATIKNENKASIKCFEKVGFEAVSVAKNQQQSNADNTSQRLFHLTLI
jgi:RimJ/RimL family protein N-acetyltransferase